MEEECPLQRALPNPWGGRGEDTMESIGDVEGRRRGGGRTRAGVGRATMAGCFARSRRGRSCDWVGDAMGWGGDEPRVGLLL